ncbi:hypothetical protein BDQ17DRAFT_1408540 [Cyathus striatus]|nr:hypothetical protein BDQ17DRAFT_1408540 [Cyathus striatus]
MFNVAQHPTFEIHAPLNCMKTTRCRFYVFLRHLLCYLVSASLSAWFSFHAVLNAVIVPEREGNMLNHVPYAKSSAKNTRFNFSECRTFHEKHSETYQLALNLGNR